MKKHATNSPCKKCAKPYCHEEVVCPECNGQGLFDAMPLFEEPSDYGLNFSEEFACPACDGRGTMTAYCTHYMNRSVPAYFPARRDAARPSAIT